MNPKCLVLGLPTLFTGGKAKCRAKESDIAENRVTVDVERTISVSSPAFCEDAPIPQQYSQDGLNISPPLAWSNLPAGTQAITLIVEDPDAPMPMPYVHWIVANLPATTTGLPESFRATLPATEGLNSAKKPGWVGCAPPNGDDPHHYHFQLFALDAPLVLPPEPNLSDVVKALEGHILAIGEIIGTYQR